MPVRGDCFARNYQGRAKSCSVLRQRLGHLKPDREDRPAPEPELSWQWCSPRAWSANSRFACFGSLGGGLGVAVRTTAGGVWVGTLEACDWCGLTLHLWGVLGARTFPIVEVAGLMVLDRHSHAEERVVRERQHKGLPGIELAPVVPLPPPEPPRLPSPRPPKPPPRPRACRGLFTSALLGLPPAKG